MTPANKAQGSNWEFEVICTRWVITTREPIAQPVRAQVTALIADYDRALSRFHPDSLVFRLRDTSVPVVFPSYTRPLFELFDALVTLTEGAPDPTVGASLEALGYDANYTFHVKPPQPAPGCHTVERRGTTLRATGPVLLDVGAAGKGHLVDLVFEHLAAAGYPATVDAGGDIRTAFDLRVGLEPPDSAEHVIGVSELHAAAIGASASGKRRWAPGVHHVLDARTGRPVEGIVATWAIAETALRADAVATAAFFCRPDALGVQWLRVDARGRAEASSGFDVELVT